MTTYLNLFNPLFPGDKPQCIFLLSNLVKNLSQILALNPKLLLANSAAHRLCLMFRKKPGFPIQDWH